MSIAEFNEETGDWVIRAGREEANTRYQYRVVWMRKEFQRYPKKRNYETERGARRFMTLLGPEPWLAFDPNAKPDDLKCCGGYECNCQGLTNKEFNDAKEWGEVEWVRLERRKVSEWGEAAP